MKAIARVGAIIIAVLMVFGLFAGALSMMAGAAEIRSVSNLYLRTPESNSPNNIVKGTTISKIAFQYQAKASDLSTYMQTEFNTFETEDFYTNNNTWNSGHSKLNITNQGKNDDLSSSTETYYDMLVEISNIVYNGKTYPTEVALNISSITYLESGTKTNYKDKFFLDIALSYFKQESSGNDGSSSGDPLYTSKPVLENIVITDKNGNRLDEVTKDTPPFIVTVTYLEYGLEDADFYDLLDGSLSVYVTNWGGFYSDSGTRGTLTHANRSNDGTPRFKAVFKDVTYDESSQALTITPYYHVDSGTPVSGELSLTVKQAKAKEESSSTSDEVKIAPLKPNIVITSYDYGKEPIVAGSSFTLNLSYKNTSRDIGLENIIMTVTPDAEYFTIAAGSNSAVDVPSLGIGATLSHSVDLQALSNAKVGSGSVTVKFTYQYVDYVNEKREEGSNEQIIAVPLTQIDRFSVEPITEMADYATVGEQFFVTVTFTNKGKSATQNISASVKGNLDFVAARQHFGNLEPGKTDSLDLMITPNESGEMAGEITVSYEDEMSNQKEISVPFSIYVDEPWVPDYDNMGGMEEMPPDPNAGGLNMRPAAIILCSVGAVLIAAPLLFYFYKRAKRKESEDFDEDF